MPPGNSLHLAERIPGIWLARFPGGGHMMMYQYPERLRQLILTFLS